MSFYPGDCFLIQTYIDQDGNPVFHLFVVILDPVEFNGDTIIVSVSTVRGGSKYDETTILHPGEEVPEFINRISYVKYRLSQIVSVEVLEEKKEKGELILREDRFSQREFERICLGLDRSGFTPGKVKRLYHESIYNQLD